METERCGGQWNRLGLSRDAGESWAKQSTTSPAGPRRLLARDAEEPLGPLAWQAVGPNACFMHVWRKRCNSANFPRLLEVVAASAELSLMGFGWRETAARMNA